MILRIVLFLLSALAVQAAVPRRIYIPTIFQVDERANEVVVLLECSAKAVYPHALVSHSKLSRFANVTANCAPNIAEVGVQISPRTSHVVMSTKWRRDDSRCLRIASAALSGSPASIASRISL